MHRKSTIRGTSLVAGLCLLTSAHGIALADDDDRSDMAKYREVVMEGLGSHTGALAMIFSGRVDLPDQLQAHADAIAAAGQQIGTLFPAGSEGGEALPLIWEEPEEFQARVAKVEEATAGIAAAAKSGDRKTLAQAFKALGESCKGCHDRYREED